MTINYYARCGNRFLLNRNREDDARPLSVRASTSVRRHSHPAAFWHMTPRGMARALARSELDDGNAEKHR